MSENLYKCPKCGKDLYSIYEDKDNWGITPTSKLVEICNFEDFSIDCGEIRGHRWIAIIHCPDDKGIVTIEDSDI